MKNENDIVSKSVDEAADIFVKNHDDYLLKCLEPYGITPENVKEQSSRVTIYSYDDLQTGIRKERYHIDGKYAFDIRVRTIFKAYSYSPNDIYVTQTYEQCKEEITN